MRNEIWTHMYPHHTNELDDELEVSSEEDEMGTFIPADNGLNDFLRHTFTKAVQSLLK